MKWARMKRENGNNGGALKVCRFSWFPVDNNHSVSPFLKNSNMTRMNYEIEKHTIQVKKAFSIPLVS